MRSVMLLLASVLKVHNVVYCYVILPSMTLQKAQGMICGFFNRRGLVYERNIIKNIYKIHI